MGLCFWKDALVGCVSKVGLVALRNSRTPLSITFSVWKALFLREAVFRLSTGRAAWMWLLLEPVIVIIFHLFWYSTVHIGTIGGMNIAVWFMLGMSGFFMFRRTGLQSINAIDANKTLFSYRQVKPVDTVLVRACLEGFLMTVTLIILCIAVGLYGLDIIPTDPLMAFAALCGMWLVGLGFGLIFSVARELVPEVGKFIDLSMLPLYFMSGILFPINIVPEPYYDWLLFNPLIHGAEIMRLSFAPVYQAAPGLSISYLYGFALTTIFFGLALHSRFAARMMTQ